jgi:hypothetical protein
LLPFLNRYHDIIETELYGKTELKKNAQSGFNLAAMESK